MGTDSNIEITAARITSAGIWATAVYRQQDAVILTTGDRLIDRWVFGRDISVVDVWADGAHFVRSGRYIRRQRMQSRYQTTVQHSLLGSGPIDLALAA